MQPDASPALDSLVPLTMALHRSPGVYAVLLGSGVSTGAGVPTGWGVVRELVRRAAAAAAPDDREAGDRAFADPEIWWAAHGDGAPLTYSGLLARLARTPAARKALLYGFFEPTPADSDAGRKVPSAAHHAIAALAKRGTLQVILTTNFDKLMEQALVEADVAFQVIARPSAVDAMTPLQHAGVTLIKLHGDYTDEQSRNTVLELEDYPQQWRTLLARIGDEYGLLISGWSAESDVALVRALQQVRSRRYPLYWDSRSSNKPAARQLLHQHNGQVIPAASADELFTGLVASLDALDKAGDRPFTTADAVAKVKRYLTNPAHRIDLRDYVMRETEKVMAQAQAQPVYLPPSASWEALLEQRRADTATLIHMVANGVAYDRDREFTHLWVAVLQRLMQARTVPSGTFQQTVEALRHLPALLVMRAAGVTATHQGYGDVLFRVLSQPVYRSLMQPAPVPAVHALHELGILDPEMINSMARWNWPSRQRWRYPQSHLLRTDLREPLRDLIPDDGDYQLACDGYEYRSALLVQGTQQVPGAHRIVLGELLSRDRRIRSSVEEAQQDFLDEAAAADDSWPWWGIVGGRDGLKDELLALREALDRVTDPF